MIQQRTDEEIAIGDAQREAVAAKLWELLTSGYSRRTPWVAVHSAQKARYLEMAAELIAVAEGRPEALSTLPAAVQERAFVPNSPMVSVAQDEGRLFPL